MASIEPIGKGFRVVWWTAGRGSPRGKSQVYRRRKDAERACRLITAQRKAARPPGRGILPWTEVRERFMGHLVAAGRSERYLVEVDRALDRHTQDWKTTDDALPSVVAGILTSDRRIVRAVLRHAHRRLGQPVDVLSMVAPDVRAGRRPEAPLLADTVVHRLIADAQRWGPAEGAIVHLIASYGHRAQSLVGLSCQAVDPKAGTLTIPVKGGDVVRHPLAAGSLELLRPLLAKRRPTDALFVRHCGTPWKDGRDFASWFRHTFNPAFGYYELKRWAISRMLAAGLDAKTVAAITGHRTVSLLLNTYARTNEQRQRDAIATLTRIGLPVGKQRRQKAASGSGVTTVSPSKSHKSFTRR